VVKEAAELGANTICLSGGEPFLHSRITDMVKYIASLGLQSYIYTSGIVFDGNNSRTSIGKDVLRMISQDVTKLIFNIEAAAPKTYNAIMGTQGCFNLMKQSVCNANKLGIVTEAHFVPMKLNIGEIMGVVDLCNELHITKLSFLRLVLHGRAQANEKNIALTNDELELLKTQLESLTDKITLDIRIGVPLSLDFECHKCEAARGKLNIKYDGNVFPCEVFKNDRMSQCLKGLRPDSIYNSSLTDIYNNSKYLKYVRDMERDFVCTRECETCLGQYLIKNEEEHTYGNK
jgi:MoaA/NifB/PqqE/SkfB family radical SAM enzyme